MAGTRERAEGRDIATDEMPCNYRRAARAAHKVMEQRGPRGGRGTGGVNRCDVWVAWRFRGCGVGVSRSTGRFSPGPPCIAVTSGMMVIGAVAVRRTSHVESPLPPVVRTLKVACLAQALRGSRGSSAGYLMVLHLPASSSHLAASLFLLHPDAHWSFYCLVLYMVCTLANDLKGYRCFRLVRHTAVG